MIWDNINTIRYRMVFIPGKVYMKRVIYVVIVCFSIVFWLVIFIDILYWLFA